MSRASFPETLFAPAAETAAKLARAPSHLPSDEISRAAWVTVPSMIDSPISSAIADKIRRSERFSESATAASKARARPSQLRNEPDFSVTAATGRTTSATLVTAECAISSETTNDFESAASAAALFGISCGSTPPTTTASSEPLPRLSIISEVVRPTFVGIV